MPVVYIDVLLIVNLWVDFLLLLATARVLHLSYNRKRLFLGAVLGAAASFLLFLPPLPWWGALALRLGGTVLIAVVAFPRTTCRRFFVTVFVFFVLSAGFAGVATMLWYIAAPNGLLVINGVVYYDAPASLLIVFTAFSYIAICIYEYVTRRRAPRGRMYTLFIYHNEKAVVCRCLYDSGCTLREPFSGKAAVVAEQNAVKDILPPEFCDEGAIGMRLIPFRTLGGEGVLSAFQPQRMEMCDKKGNRWNVSGCYLAVSEQLNGEEYTALCGTDIGEMLVERGHM